MKIDTSKLKAHWQALAPREQYAISAAAGFVCVLIFYFFILSPLSAQNIFLRKEMVIKTKSLQEMKRLDAQLQSAKSSIHSSINTDSPATLLSELQQLAKHYNVTKALVTLKQSGDNSIAMDFQNVDFDRLVQLLTEVTQSASVQITQFNVTRTTTLGLVNAEVVISFG